VPKPARTVRAFLIGGSAAYGDTGGYPYIDDPCPRIYNYQLIDHYLEAELNHAFPSVRWEVINAAAVGYRLYQQLALVESVLLHYQPDYVILMDGYNDVFQIQQAPDNYDPYAATPYKDDFEELANPQSLRGLFRMSSILLAQHSALFRSVKDHWSRLANRTTVKHALAQTADFDKVTLQDLSPADQQQFERSRRQIGYYAHTARQINRILRLDGVTPLFLLQPVLILSDKPLTPGERKLRETHLRVIGRASAYTFRELYAVIANDMREAAKQDGFLFEDLSGAIDHTSDQVFTDYCHLTPAANRAIAGRIYANLKDSFVATAARYGEQHSRAPKPLTAEVHPLE
jgi:lysophospholipase L1-like esterase